MIGIYEQEHDFKRKKEIAPNQQITNRCGGKLS
jgi:hypothetical protein